MYLTAVSPVVAFVAGIVAALFVFGVKKEMNIETKQYLEVKNKWKDYVPLPVHTGVFDNNSIPGGP